MHGGGGVFFSAAAHTRKGEAERPWRDGNHVDMVAIASRRRSRTAALQPLSGQRSEQLQVYLTAQLSGLSAGADAGPDFSRPSSRASSAGASDSRPARGHSASSFGSRVASSVDLSVGTMERWPARMTSTEGDRRGHVMRDRIAPNLDSRPSSPAKESGRALSPGGFRHTLPRPTGTSFSVDDELASRRPQSRGSMASTAGSGTVHTVPRYAAPGLLVDLEGYVNSELQSKGVVGAEHTGDPKRLAIFSECFDCFIEHCTTYRPLLAKIKAEFDAGLSSLGRQVDAQGPTQTRLAVMSEEHKSEVRTDCALPSDRALSVPAARSENQVGTEVARVRAALAARLAPR